MSIENELHQMKSTFHEGYGQVQDEVSRIKGIAENQRIMLVALFNMHQPLR